MVKLPLSLILVFFLVKTDLAAPSTEARFKDEIKSRKTQELSLWITKYMTKIKTVVLERIENIKNWDWFEAPAELASLKGGLISDFDAVITDVKSRLKGTVYQSKPCNLLHFGKIYSS